MRLDHSTVAKSIGRMETAGLLERRKSASDGRVAEVCLTAKGRELLDQIRAAWARLEERTTAGLTADERREFVRIARKIAPQRRLTAAP